MLRRAFLFLLALPLAACVGEPYAIGGRGAMPSPLGGGPGAPPAGRQVAALLPLSGPNAALGQAMLQAVQLALAAPGSPPLDAEDTGGTPDGAANAARAALGKGAGLFVGPLTTAETAAVAPVAQAAGVPVLALTSDVAQARPGVWTLGITPGQQVRTLVRAAQAEGKARFAAVLPQSAFGNALADGLTAATAESGLPPPTLRRYSLASAASLDHALKDVSDYSGRRDAIAAQQAAGAAQAPAPAAAPAAPAPPAGGDEAAGQAPDQAQASPETSSAPPEPVPLPFDALLLGAVGPDLRTVAAQLAPDGILPTEVRVLGPALWEHGASRVPALAGAWFAAPDPAARGPFEAAYVARYGSPPRDSRASLAYDAGGLARASAGPGGFDVGVLQRPEGFAGSDGLLALLPDGHVRRAFAIFEVQPGGAHIVQPAPQSFAPPGA
jgi:branched-chain amino acid transport system substrate-binding protein